MASSYNILNDPRNYDFSVQESSGYYNYFQGGNDTRMNDITISQMWERPQTNYWWSEENFQTAVSNHSNHDDDRRMHEIKSQYRFQKEQLYGNQITRKNIEIKHFINNCCNTIDINNSSSSSSVNKRNDSNHKPALILESPIFELNQTRDIADRRNQVRQYNQSKLSYIIDILQKVECLNKTELQAFETECFYGEFDTIKYSNRNVLQKQRMLSKNGNINSDCSNAHNNNNNGKSGKKSCVFPLLFKFRNDLSYESFESMNEKTRLLLNSRGKAIKLDNFASKFPRGIIGYISKYLTKEESRELGYVNRALFIESEKSDYLSNRMNDGPIVIDYQLLEKISEYHDDVLFYRDQSDLENFYNIVPFTFTKSKKIVFLSSELKIKKTTKKAKSNDKFPNDVKKGLKLIQRLLLFATYVVFKEKSGECLNDNNVVDLLFSKEKHDKFELKLLKIDDCGKSKRNEKKKDDFEYSSELLGIAERYHRYCAYKNNNVRRLRRLEIECQLGIKQLLLKLNKNYKELRLGEVECCQSKLHGHKSANDADRSIDITSVSELKNIFHSNLTKLEIPMYYNNIILDCENEMQSMGLTFRSNIKEFVINMNGELGVHELNTSSKYVLGFEFKPLVNSNKFKKFLFDLTNVGIVENIETLGINMRNMGLTKDEELQSVIEDIVNVICKRTFLNNNFQHRKLSTIRFNVQGSRLKCDEEDVIDVLSKNIIKCKSNFVNKQSLKRVEFNVYNPLQRKNIDEKMDVIRNELGSNIKLIAKYRWTN